MSTLVGNDCAVQTILPMSVECSVTNASSPLTMDGAIYLNITGGSTPYSIKWNNGSNTQNLYNLSAGTYTATVVDYYGDYSATTTCTVDSNITYVDTFLDCSNEYNLYFTGLTDSFTIGEVYRINDNLGSFCYTYVGQTLMTDSPLNIGEITEGPFQTCEECDPVVIPPYYPSLLCLYTPNPFTSYQFEFYGFLNGKPTYTGTSVSSSGYTIEWVTGTTNQWQVMGKPGNTLTNSYDTYNPLGSWVLNGTQQSWVAEEGSCPAIVPLSATHSLSDPVCENTCNGGSAVISVNGGVPPYLYSFDGGPFSALPSKLNLCPGNHTYQVTDSISSVYNGAFVINKGAKVNNYVLSISYTTEDVLINYGTEVSRRLKYKVDVTPPLPSGVEITVPINLSIDTKEYSPGKVNVSYTPYFYSGSTIVSPTSNSLTNTNIVKPNYYANSYPYPYTGRTFNVSYNNVVLKKDLVVSGYVDTNIVKTLDPVSFCSPGCVPHLIQNPSSSVQYYNWTNCTGGTEDRNSVGLSDAFKLQAGESVSICACSVRKGSVLNALDGNSLIITRNAGSLSCSPLPDGDILVSTGFGAPSINGRCNTLRVQTPPAPQLISQLFQFGVRGSDF